MNIIAGSPLTLSGNNWFRVHKANKYIVLSVMTQLTLSSVHFYGKLAGRQSSFLSRFKHV